MVYKQLEIFGCSSVPRFVRTWARANAAEIGGHADRQSTFLTANIRLLSILSERLRRWQQPLDKQLKSINESAFSALLILTRVIYHDALNSAVTQWREAAGLC